MSQFQRIALLVVLNCGVYLLVSLLNSFLARWSLGLTLDVVYVLMAALYLRTLGGLVVTSVAGLMVGAVAPVLFGTHLAAYALVFTLVMLMRHRIRRESSKQVALMAFAGNALIFVIVALSAAGDFAGDVVYWQALAVSFMLSQLVVVFVGPRLVKVERTVFLMAGADLGAELHTF